MPLTLLYYCLLVREHTLNMLLLQSYKTFARRHHRRRHNEYLKQQVAKGWDDFWDTVSLEKCSYAVWTSECNPSLAEMRQDFDLLFT